VKFYVKCKDDGIYSPIHLIIDLSEGLPEMPVDGVCVGETTFDEMIRLDKAKSSYLICRIHKHVE